MKRKNKNLVLVLFAIFSISTLFSKEIVIDKRFFELEVMPGKTILIDFPYEIRGKQVLAKKEDFTIQDTEKSIYLKIEKGEADVTVWSEEVPILLTIIAKKGVTDRRFSFINEEDYVEKKAEKKNQWNHDTEAIAILEQFINKKKAKGFKIASIDELFKLENNLMVEKVVRASGKKYKVEVWNLMNVGKNVIDLFEVNEMYYTSEQSPLAIEANTFDDRYLVPNQSTRAYVLLKDK